MTRVYVENLRLSTIQRFLLCFFVDNPASLAHNRGCLPFNEISPGLPSRISAFSVCRFQGSTSRNCLQEPELSDKSSLSSPFAHRSRQIAESLRNDILSGRMVAGLRLTELDLAQRFGVGRSLVREAVQQLSMQGLLVTRPNCGAAVAPEAPREIRQLIIPIRRTVEAYALQLVFDDLTEEDFQRWEEILDKMKKAGEEEDNFTVAEMDVAFHRLLLERAGQPDLLLIWDALVGRIRSHFRRMQRRYKKLTDVYVEHAALLAGYRSKDVDEAVRLLKANIE